MALKCLYSVISEYPKRNFLKPSWFENIHRSYNSNLNYFAFVTNFFIHLIEVDPSTEERGKKVFSLFNIISNSFL